MTATNCWATGSGLGSEPQPATPTPAHSNTAASSNRAFTTPPELSPNGSGATLSAEPDKLGQPWARRGPGSVDALGPAAHRADDLAVGVALGDGLPLVV